VFGTPFPKENPSSREKSQTLPVLTETGRTCFSKHIQGTHSCDHAITWTTGECLLRFLLCVCLHFACLVIFSWTPSQQAI